MTKQKLIQIGKPDILDLSQNNESFFNKIMLDITTVPKCNLHCPVCYRDGHDQEDMPIEKIQHLANTHQNKVFLISGGEPTTRKELGHILRMLNKKNICFVMSNGIKFANSTYTKKLVKQGLQYVSFSLNGLNDDVMVQTHGEKLLDIKLKALQNLKKCGVQVLLSVTVSKGVNDDQINALFDYYKANRDFVKELRIRSMAPLGSRIHDKKYTTMDLLQLVCDQLHLDYNQVLKERLFEKLVNKHINEKYQIMACKFNFHAKYVQGKLQPVFHNITLDENDPLIKYKLFAIGAKAFGYKTCMHAFFKTTLNKEVVPWVHDKNIFKISLRSWRDESDFNLKENAICKTGYYINDRIISYCRANIIKDLGMEHRV